MPRSRVLSVSAVGVALQQFHGRFVGLGRAVIAQTHQDRFVVASNTGVCAFKPKQVTPCHRLSRHVRNHFLHRCGGGVGIVVNQPNCFSAWGLPIHLLNCMILNIRQVLCGGGTADQASGDQGHEFGHGKILSVCLNAPQVMRVMRVLSRCQRLKRFLPELGARLRSCALFYGVAHV